MQQPSHVAHDGEAHVAVDGDLGQRALAEHPLDGPAVAGPGEAQQFLVAVGEVVVLVVADHVDRLAHLGVVTEVPDQHVHLVGGALFGDAAVREVDDDVLLGQGHLAAQLLVREADAAALQQHRVVGLGGYRDGGQAALAEQGVEDPAVLVLVGAVSGDLGREVAHAVRHQGRDTGVLPAALGLPAGGDGAEQLEGVVVVDDLLEQAAGREHGTSQTPVGGAGNRWVALLVRMNEIGGWAATRNPAGVPGVVRCVGRGGEDPPSPHHGRRSVHRAGVRPPAPGSVGQAIRRDPPAPSPRCRRAGRRSARPG